MKYFAHWLAVLGLLFSVSFAQAPNPGIPSDCTSWFDGCNTCGVENGNLTFCTQMACGPGVQRQPYCKAFAPKPPVAPTPQIPDSCTQWFDGCNVCSVDNGQLNDCTQRECLANPAMARCQKYLGDGPGVMPSSPGVSVSVENPVSADDDLIQDFNDPTTSIPLPMPSVGIPPNCTSWFDGCNTCMVKDGVLGGCTRMACVRQGQAYCKAYAPEPSVAPTPQIPDSCTSWFDGCNVCSVVNGQLTDCTQRECLANSSQARCQAYLGDTPSAMPSQPSVSVTSDISVSSDDDYRALDFDDPTTSIPLPMPSVDIPTNCTSWYDGCNTCEVVDGQITACTEMACSAAIQQAPYCEKYGTSPDEPVTANPGSSVMAEMPLPMPSVENENNIESVSLANNRATVKAALPEPTFWGFIKYHLFFWQK